MNLKCGWCKEEKPEELFIKRVRKLPYSQSNVRCCRQCQSEYQKKRYGVPALRAKQLKANAQWRKAHPDQQRAHEKKFGEKYPNQVKARNRIRYLIRSGQITRGKCEICGSDEMVDGHHDSYAPAHWDTVRWLCRSHHEKWHIVLDKIKKRITRARIDEAIAKRNEAKQIQAQILALRDRHRELLAEADNTELDAYNLLVAEANKEFEHFKEQQ